MSDEPRRGLWRLGCASCARRALWRARPAATEPCCRRLARAHRGSRMKAEQVVPFQPAPWRTRVSWREWRVHFLRVLRPYWKKVVLAHLAMLLDATLTVMRPWPLKVVIDGVISQRHSRVPFVGHWVDSLATDRMTLLYGACAASLLIALGTGLSTFYYTRAMGSIGEHFTFDLRRRLFAHMQRLSLRFHDRQRTGDLTTRLGSDINAIDDLITDSSQIVLYNGALLVGMVTVMLWLNWQFALVALSVAPLLFATIVRFRWRIRTVAREARTSDGLATSVAQETLS